MAIASTITEKFAAYNGDCVEVVAKLPDDSVGFSVYSPPFANLYIYSDSERDMGNCKTNDEFFDHYKFLIREKYRVTIPGRVTAIHCKDLPAYYHRDGYAGLKDFPGEIIKAHEECGWKFHSRVTIWKCPVTERERTNNNGLLHKTVLRDRSQLRQGMADYLIIMRKVGDDLMSDVPVAPGEGLIDYVGIDECDPRVENSFHPSKFARKKVASIDSINIWRRYAEPVWWDINQQNVLNAKIARDNRDEKHICPLQLDVIDRAIQLWSMEGDTVLSPFMGIGSEGYCAVKMGRRFIGSELKESYWKQACNNLKNAESMSIETDLFADAD
jgi:DNA modification methylase